MSASRIKLCIAPPEFTTVKPFGVDVGPARRRLTGARTGGTRRRTSRAAAGAAAEVREGAAGLHDHLGQRGGPDRRAARTLQTPTLTDRLRPARRRPWPRAERS